MLQDLSLLGAIISATVFDPFGMIWLLEIRAVCGQQHLWSMILSTYLQRTNKTALAVKPNNKKDDSAKI